MQAYSRRDIMRLLAMTSASIGAAEAGLVRPAAAARDFVWASTGGAWGEHVNDIFVKQGNFAEIAHVTPTSSFQLETIATSKILVAKGDPPYDVSDHGQAEVVTMQEAGLVLPYTRSLMPNYANVAETAKMGDSYVSTSFLLWGLTWNTKEVAKAPASFEALLSPDLKGRIGIPAFGWYGNYWMNALNKTLGGNEDNLDPALKFAAQMVKQNNAVIIENADHGRKVFSSGDVVMAPFWNGITTQLRRAGTPLKFETVPGTLAIGTGFIILKGTQYRRGSQQVCQHHARPQVAGVVLVVEHVSADQPSRRAAAGAR